MGSIWKSCKLQSRPCRMYMYLEKHNGKCDDALYVSRWEVRRSHPQQTAMHRSLDQVPPT